MRALLEELRPAIGLKFLLMIAELEWIKLYRAALRETDPDKQPARIEEAKRAMKQALLMAVEYISKIFDGANNYAAASGFVESCFSLSAFKPNLASSSCTIRAVCALCRMWVNNAPRAMPNISIPSNNRTSGRESTTTWI